MDLETLTGISFLCLAALLLIVERFPGMRRAPASMGQRWLTNLGLWLLAGILATAIYSESITAIAAGSIPLRLRISCGVSGSALPSTNS